MCLYYQWLCTRCFAGQSFIQMGTRKYLEYMSMLEVAEFCTVVQVSDTTMLKSSNAAGQLNYPYIFTGFEHFSNNIHIIICW